METLGKAYSMVLGLGPWDGPESRIQGALAKSPGVTDWSCGCRKTLNPEL